MKTISVIIPSYNRFESLRLVLDGLTGSGLEKCDEVIIVDDGSGTDPARSISDILENNSNIRIIYHGWNRGPAAARNTGVKNAVKDVVLFIGDDMIPEKGFISGHRDFHQKHGDNYACLGRVDFYKGISVNDFMISVTEKGKEQFAYSSLKDEEQEVQCGFFYTCNISIDKGFIEKNGMFDEVFPFASFEDVELGLRLELKGLKLIYEPSILVHHNHVLNLKEFIKRQYMGGRSFYYFALKHDYLERFKMKINAGAGVNQSDVDAAVKDALNEEKKGASGTLYKKYSAALSLSHKKGFLDEITANASGRVLVFLNGEWETIEKPGGTDITAADNIPVMRVKSAEEIAGWLKNNSSGRAVIYEPNEFVYRFLSGKFDSRRVARAGDIAQAQKASSEGLNVFVVDEGYPAGIKNVNIKAQDSLKISVISPMYGGSYEMAYYAAEGFIMNGHEAKVMDNSKYYRDFAALSGNPVEQAKFAQAMMTVICRDILEDKPDVVFGLAQAPLSAAALAMIRKAGILTAFWFVEDFRTLTYWKNSYKNYDIYFVIQNGVFIKKINSSGGNAFFLPVAARVPAGKKATGAVYSSSVSFAGAPYRNRVRIMTGLKDEGIAIYGEGWSAAGAVLKKNIRIGNRRVSAEELRAIYSMSGVNINLYSSNAVDGLEEHGDFINPRSFEIPAAGGFQLCDQRKGIEDFFRTGDEIELYSSVEELKDKARFFRDNPSAAAKIAKAGEKRVKDEHTYFHRMKQAVEIIKTGRPHV
jgi:spore maturation protein CgeB